MTDTFTFSLFKAESAQVRERGKEPEERVLEGWAGLRPWTGERGQPGRETGKCGACVRRAGSTGRSQGDRRLVIQPRGWGSILYVRERSWGFSAGLQSGPQSCAPEPFMTRVSSGASLCLPVPSHVTDMPPKLAQSRKQAGVPGRPLLKM